MRKNFLLVLIVLMIIPLNFFAAFSSKGDSKAVIEGASKPSIGSPSDALKEFKSLSKRERKERINEAKKALKKYKQDKTAAAEPSTNTLLLVIIAILLPPLAVYLHQGEINGKFWLCLLLTLLLYVPGLIYALVLILGKD